MDCRGDTGIGGVPVEASETCRGMAEAIAALTLLRDRYKAAGKLIAARTVQRCIAVVRMACK